MLKKLFLISIVLYGAQVFGSKGPTGVELLCKAAKESFKKNFKPCAFAVNASTKSQFEHLCKECCKRRYGGSFGPGSKSSGSGSPCLKFACKGLCKTRALAF